jgi:signal transduction histidine kinase
MTVSTPNSAYLMRLVRPQRLLRQFGLAAFLSIIGGMAATGGWLTKEIQNGVIENTTLSTAVFMERFVHPHVTELKTNSRLSQEAIAKLDILTTQGLIQSHVASAKIWLPDGTVAYSTDHSVIGKKFPPEEALLAAAAGKFATEYSELSSEENLFERTLGKKLIEIYVPLVEASTGEVFAIGEFYVDANALPDDISRRYLMSWLVVGFVTIAMLLPLFLIVRRGDKTINLQESALKMRVQELSSLLEKNQKLMATVNRNNQSSTKINESFLNRIGADLHDGPIQLLAASLLWLENLAQGKGTNASTDRRARIDLLKTTITDALKELRTIASGLVLPELSGKTLAEILTIVVDGSMMRSKEPVKLELHALPNIQVTMLNNAVYRFVQEGLNNSFQHAEARERKVSARVESDTLFLEISDNGRGFVESSVARSTQHLGISGMRNRIRAVGGQFEVISKQGEGTVLRAQIPLRQFENPDAKEREQVNT